MTVSFLKSGALFAALVLALFAASSAQAEEFGHGRGPGFGRPVPGFGRPGFGPGFYRGPGFRPGFGPGYRGPGWGPGYAPGYGPGFVPGPGYVYTCFAVGNAGTPFYATSYDPNLAQAQALQFCASTGQFCQPTGCR